eukprot:TRINITY_DN14311_c0_g1_i4.p1 TRINITY_DN14311_c0_g1~~TRINITY_DN14311_c0_g1_i4.p1  ORF type:complete len:426 (-),score=53.19 TRINITY_DN14311_c0_g1_i4:349-1626(-)
MGLSERSLPVCPRNQHCARWAQIYLKYCFCSVRDGLSLTLGLVSVISWGVAEVPQIITNNKEKSTEGLSVAFLMTWIIGDLFNLFGCKLEPATLPTQYYMAMLYMVTTVILASQTIYYGHIYHRLKANKIAVFDKGSKDQVKTMTGNKKIGGNIDDRQFKVHDNQTNGSSVSVEGVHTTSSPIPVASAVLTRYGSRGRDLYYTSARSLSSSSAHLSHSNEAGRNSPLLISNQNSIQEPLLGGRASVQSTPPSKIKSTLCMVSVMTFFLFGFNLHLSMNNRSNLDLRKPRQGVIIHVARKLLQDDSRSSFGQGTDGSSGMGTYLGWAMAAIYMGGRLPQICLNIRRGNVEGLNPLMFIFALVGNITYVGSILVSSLDWSKLKPNLPWLVDAGGCILLDSFIVLQFMYFRCRRHKDSKSSYDHVGAE